MITLIALVVAGAVGAAAWFFVLAPSGEDDAEPEGPIAGEVYTIESMNINLAEGRYLRVGFGLQFIEGADVDHFDPAKARNAAIEVYPVSRSQTSWTQSPVKHCACNTPAILMNCMRVKLWMSISLTMSLNK